MVLHVVRPIPSIGIPGDAHVRLEVDRRVAAVVFEIPLDVAVPELMRFVQDLEYARCPAVPVLPLLQSLLAVLLRDARGQAQVRSYALRLMN